MWVRMRMSLSLSGWAIHGLLWPGDSRWDGDTGVDSEGHSNSDADCLILLLLVVRY